MKHAPVEPSPRVDRRVVRTREALRDALLNLMVEQGWDGIDVQSLCERANIGRSTFYQHFSNKEELLKGSFAGLRNALRPQSPAGKTYPPGQLAFVGGLVAHVYQERTVFRAILGRRSGHYVQDRFRELLVEMVEDEQLGGQTQTWQAVAKANYLGGALFQLLVWWLGTSRPQQPQEIEALFHQLSGPVLLSGPSG